MSNTQAFNESWPIMPTAAPWLWLFFISAAFFIAGNDWFYSLKAIDVSGTEVFGTSVDDFSRFVEQGNLLHKIVFVLLGSLSALSLLKQGIWRGVRVNGALGWVLVIFLCWAFLSLSWSENPDLSVRKLGLLAMLVAGALAVSQRFETRQVILWVLLSTSVYLNLGIVAELQLGTFHPFSPGYRFTGTMFGPNCQSPNCILLLYAAFFLLKVERRWRKLLVTIVLEALIFLFLTKSRTSIALGGLTLILYWCLKGPLSHEAFMAVCLASLCCFVALFSDFFLPILDHAMALGREDTDTLTLTGRVPIWGQLLAFILRQPFTGYGYGGFWSPRHIEEVARTQEWAVVSAHSAYVDIMLDLGVVGGVAYVLIVFLGIKRALVVRKRSDDALFGFMVVVLMFAGLHGLLESAPITPGYNTFVDMVILAWLGFSMRSLQAEYAGNGERCERLVEFINLSDPVSRPGDKSLRELQ